MKNRFYPESRFGGFTNIDGTITFYSRINALINKEDTILDIGCGRDAAIEDPLSFRRNLRNLRGKVKKVIGIDVDPVAKNNPTLDLYLQIKDHTEKYPLPDESVDLLFCDQVLEHVEDPSFFFAECRRVLRSGGYLCIRTTNKWGYIGIGARIIPNHSHSIVLDHLQENRKEEDVFPTLYRCNSISAIRTMLKRNSFDGVAYGYSAEPSYFTGSLIGYSLLKFYHWVVPSFLRPIIFVFVRKGYLF